MLLSIFSLAAFSGIEAGVGFGYVRETGLSDQDLNNKLKHEILMVEEAFSRKDAARIKVLSDSIIWILNSGNVTDVSLLAAGFYYAGASLAYTQRSQQSFEYFLKALDILKNWPDDKLKSRVLYFMGYAANLTGDHLSSDRYFIEAMEIKKRLFGEESEELMSVYVSGAIAKINLRDYEGAKKIIDEVLDKIRRKIFTPTPSDRALLYQNRGIALANMSEQKQAILNMLRSLEIQEKYELPLDDNRLNLINNIATTYYYLREYDRCLEYFEKGLEYAESTKSVHARDLSVNYALTLGRLGHYERGKQIFDGLLSRHNSEFGQNSRESVEIALNYADYLRITRLDLEQCLKLYRLCFNYSDANPWDLTMRTRVVLGYSFYLIDQRLFRAALDSVSFLLYRNSGLAEPENIHDNPEAELLQKDRVTLDILKAKYLALYALSEIEGSMEYLALAVNTADLMIKLIENTRFLLGEEESRVLLGERFRDSYLMAIAGNKKTFDLTLNPVYFEKAFQYAERSKAASLLTSMRESMGIKFHVPEQIARLEKETRLRIGYYESRIAANNRSLRSDETVNRNFTDLLINELAKRDSIIDVIEKRFPEYYKYKYNNSVLGSDDVIKTTGRRADFLTYIASDTLLYIFLINHKVKVIRTQKIDTGFYGKARAFRQTLSEPVFEGDVKASFLQLQKTGYDLYRNLIEPVKEYLVSDRLIISPDRELAFFPFEAMLSSFSADTSLYHNRLPFLFRDFSISYAYSATLLAESGKVGRSLFRRAVIFAPEYPGPVEYDTSEAFRSPAEPVLMPLKYSIGEAETVSEIVNGRLFKGSSATVAAFRDESEKYNIIHLALHTVIDERSPGNSGLFFSASDGHEGKNSLNLYEISEMSLNALMVVLSSCHTGFGRMFTGEGVLSAAREFMKAGSRSVVMSLWKVDDKAGADLMKSFYKNIKAGTRKSTALKQARNKYLEKADMKQSVPYYWLSLVVYGDDSAIFLPLYLKLILPVILLIIPAVIIIYFRKRR